MNDLRLYVWRGAGVLRSYSSGIAFALAASEDEAREMLRQPIIDDQFDWLDPNEEDGVRELAERMGWLSEAPEVFQLPVAIWKRGGD